jgi:hypothetical protein
VILQVSLGMALLKISSIIVDFLMLYIFPSNIQIKCLVIFIERAIYAKEKFLKTEDFR